MINCDNIRKMTINMMNPDGTVTTSVVYFDIMTNTQITAKQAQQCPNVQALTFTCATVCNSI